MSKDEMITAAQNLVQPDTPEMYDAVNAVVSDVAELAASGATFDDALQHFGLAGEQARGDEDAIRAYFRELSESVESSPDSGLQPITDDEVTEVLATARKSGSCYAGPYYEILTYEGDGIYSVREDDEGDD